MRTIITNKQFMNAVESGKKTQTIRMWKRKTKMKEGELVALFNYHERFIVKITKIYNKKVSEITDHEAEFNGYKTANDLKDAIYNTYKTLDFDATIIRFLPAQ